MCTLTHTLMPDDIAQEEDLPCDFAIRFAAAGMSVFMPEQLMCAAVSVRSQCFPFSEIRVPHFPLLSKQRPRKSERESSRFRKSCKQHV